MRASFIAALVIVGGGAGVGGWYLGQRAPEPTAAPAVDAPAVGAPADAPAADAPAPPAEAARPSTTADRLGALFERAQRDPKDWRSHVEYTDVLPEYTEPADGPRAPSNDAFGLKIGVTTLEQAQAFVRERGLICADTSVRKMMETMRDNKAAEIAKARAEGDADGMSGASWLWRSTKHERSPHVRLTCEKVRLAVLGDRERPQDTVGRLLLMFDSPQLPLRHVTIQRLYGDDAHADARQAFIDADAAMRAKYGDPHLTRRDPPAEGEMFEKVSPVRRDWKFADLHAKVSALRLGSGVTVYEEIGVPPPIRPDAPARKQAAKP